MPDQTAPAWGPSVTPPANSNINTVLDTTGFAGAGVATVDGSVPSQLLPRTLTSNIFDKATELSAIMRLGRQVPLSLAAETTIPFLGDVPEAQWINEGQRKPLANTNVSVKQMSGKKVAVMIAASEEMVRTNPAGLWTQLQQDLPTALARAFDFAAIHGTTVSGAPGPFGLTNHLTATSNYVKLGTNLAAAGGTYADLVNAYALVADGDYDFDGWLADPRLRPSLLLSVDANGRPIWVDNVASASPALNSSLIGFPVAQTKGVSGKVNRQAGTSDSKIRAIGGDFSQCVWGQGMDITIKSSDTASFVDSNGVVHSAFQENLVLVLAEAYFGFFVNDNDAFVVVGNEDTNSAS